MFIEDYIMATAIYPGTFDPVTNGHLDILHRACHIFEKVTVGVAPNEMKHPLFSVEERIELIRMNLERDNIEVIEFDGLVVDFARKVGATALIRGLRAVSDFEFEFQMALTNRKLAPEIETLFLTPAENLSFISSSLVREISSLGGNVTPFVPAVVNDALDGKFGRK